MSKVGIIQTQPKTVIDDYGKLFELIDYQSFIKKELATIIKINLPWSLFYPVCSTPVYQLDGVLTKLIEDGYDPGKIIPTENQTDYDVEKMRWRTPKILADYVEES